MSNDIIVVSQKARDGKVMLFGFAASITANLLLFLNGSARSIGMLQVVICMKIPCYLAIPTIGIGILIKHILRGKVPNHVWGIEQTREILIQNNSLLRKFLARLYLLIYYPLYFIVAWTIGSLLFYYLALAFIIK